MTWHTSTTSPDQLTQVVADIRRRGGTIASCLRLGPALVVTWFTL